MPVVEERVEERRTQKQLETRLADVCGHLNALHAELVDLVAEMLESGGWQGGGITSPAHWVAWTTGLSPQRARQVVALAERQTELPATFAAFAAGELAVDQVAVVAKYVPARCDREAMQLAKAATVGQLRTALSRYPFTPVADARPADSKPPKQPLPSQHCSGGYNDDGTYRMHVTAPADVGAIIDTTLREACDALFRAGNKDVTWLEALSEVCARSLGAIDSPSRARLYKIHVHVGTDGAWLHQGPPLPKHVVERITCDGSLVPVWETEGRPVNFGRSSRVIPEQTRIAVQNRDHTCLHPTCNATRHLEIHHIVHWTGEDGPTETWNLGSLCPRHHDQHHRGEFTITGDADIVGGLEFRDSRGRIIHSSGRPNPPNGSPPSPTSQYRHATGERFDTRWLHFNTDQPGDSRFN